MGVVAPRPAIRKRPHPEGKQQLGSRKGRKGSVFAHFAHPVHLKSFFSPLVKAMVTPHPSRAQLHALAPKQIPHRRGPSSTSRLYPVPGVHRRRTWPSGVRHRMGPTASGCVRCVRRSAVWVVKDRRSVGVFHAALNRGQGRHPKVFD